MVSTHFLRQWSCVGLLACAAASGCSGKTRAPSVVKDKPDGEGGQGATEPSNETPISTTSVLTGSFLINYFYDESGLRIVDTNGARHFGWDGKLISEWKPTTGRAVQSAGYNGGTLVVGDSAALTVLDANLVQEREILTLEACAYLFVSSAKQAVCGPDVDWDRVFYTYSTETGQLVSSSEKYSYNGVSMALVPGRDLFISGSFSSSPSDYHLYNVNPADGVVTFVNESPYHGDFAVTDVFGFIGEPATHLVTQEGLLLNFTNAGCSADNNSFDSGCFIKDGALGSLPGGDSHYAGIANEANGKLYALVDANPDTWEAGCLHGCIVQEIDVATKAILRSSTILGLDGFAPKTPAFRFYLIPHPDKKTVWILRSGRSIYDTLYDSTAPYSVEAVVPADVN